MTEILRFFVRFAPLVYMLLAIGVLIGFRKLAQARSMMREAVFGLEKEIAHRRIGQAIAALVVSGIVALAEFILVVFLSPNVPALSLIPTPTLNPLSVPTSTYSPAMMATLAASTPNAAPPDAVTGCIPDKIMLTVPKAGAMVRGQVTLEGVVNVPNFGFYKYEYAPLGSDVWTSIGVGQEVKVEEGELGRWDTSEITPGDYQIRLVVTDNATNAFPDCVISVRVLAP